MEQMTNEELQTLTNELSMTYFDKAFMDEVRFNGRLRTTGGRYIPSERVIELNPKYLKELGKEEFIGIIKHELCHYHLHIEGKGFNHRDKDFRELMERTGSPRFCSPLPSQRARRKQVYQCTACGQLFHRVKRIDTKRYRCGKCRGKLKKV
ncbi:SprT family protein [Thalassobacillus hwangdonensis]|uniref:Protein SprT-like n=1 Tax=Thalassobacillus hwangdonensis TaxID=546108 RepID=A0ABW3L2K6_9BACI